ncbi:MAG: hypothetical protein O3C60_06055 [Planctomycetota bacterium]|nr:hypothetical protein [Planctomycetota bacterium]
MARKTDLWVAAHPADGSQLPGVRVSSDAFRVLDERMNELVRELESRWQNWVTLGSSRSSGRRLRAASWPVQAPEGND